MEEAAAMAALRDGLRQKSTIVLRLRAGHRVPGKDHSPHQVEYRVLLFHDGREIIRYSLYQDPDGRHGFPGRGKGASFALTLSERFAVDADTEHAAEVHIRYEGTLELKGKAPVRFKGSLIFDGSGRIRPGRPVIDGIDGRATFGTGCVTLGLW